jgi:hypothetical protein
MENVEGLQVDITGNELKLFRKISWEKFEESQHFGQLLPLSIIRGNDRNTEHLALIFTRLNDRKNVECIYVEWKLQILSTNTQQGKWFYSSFGELSLI